MSIGVEFVDQAGTVIGAHMMYLYRSGGLAQLVDRTGSVTLPNIRHLIAHYGAASMNIIGAATIEASGFVRHGKNVSVLIPLYRKFVGSLFQLESSYNLRNATRANGAGNALSAILPGTNTPQSSQMHSVPSTYTTALGDSLWSISHTYMGSGMQWPQIYNRNQSVIGPDPAYLRPGTKLKLR